MHRFGFAILFAAVLALSGCAGSKPFVWREPSDKVVWPVPPEKPRLRYLHTFASAADLQGEEKRGAPILRWLLGKTDADLPLATPYAVANDESGVLWIADNGSRMLYRFDLPRGEVDYIRESGGVRLRSPCGVAVDNLRRRVFVADAELAVIVLFDFEGELVGQWQPPEGFGRPAGLVLDGAGRLYAADVVKGQIFIFDADGHVLERRGSKLEGGGLFRRPLSVAIGPQGELVILDGGSFLVEIQDSRGGLLRTFGRVGDVPGTFARPRCLAVSPQGYVFVSDAAFDNVQIFDLTGRLLLHFGSSGGGVGQFNLPAGLGFDREGRLFVADTYNHRVQVFELLPESGN